MIPSMQLADKLNITPELLQQLSTHTGRIEATRNDPLLFAFYYLRHHITATDDSISLSEFHLALLEYAQSWIDGAPARTAFIAARESGKSTWLFTILPIWAAAHGHQSFVVGIADSAQQARDHLRTFKDELRDNKLLRADFNDLCTPKVGDVSGRASSFNDTMIQMRNGFVFIAKGADTSVLGLKVGNRRPSLIICDDLEGGESTYSVEDAKKRLKTLIDDILPLSVDAQIVLSGTTTRLGSIIDQVRSVAEIRIEHPDLDDQAILDYLPTQLQWVVKKRFNCYYFPAILDEGLPTERSCWPERLPMSVLNRDRGEADFQKNMMNRPVSLEDAFWSDGDIQVEEWAEFGNTIISVDPAVTTNKRSDFTGIAVISRGLQENKEKICVRHIEELKLSPEQLSAHVGGLIQEYDARVILIETNQGGDLWAGPFQGLPAKINMYRSKEHKSKRAESAFYWYEKNRVVHAKSMPAAESQMKAFPAVVHDDMVDALSAGVNYFLKREARKRVSAFVYKYK